jgi:hypothetical protein
MKFFITYLICGVSFSFIIELLLYLAHTSDNLSLSLEEREMYTHLKTFHRVLYIFLWPFYVLLFIFKLLTLKRNV